jgi:hypothetical protein
MFFVVEHIVTTARPRQGQNEVLGSGGYHRDVKPFGFDRDLVDMLQGHNTARSRFALQDLMPIISAVY